MNKSWKKIISVLMIFCFILIVIIAILLCIYYFIYYQNTYNEEWFNKSNNISTVSTIVIQPGSYWYGQMTFSTIDYSIGLNSGNFSALQPVIIDDANFSLFKQGKPYQLSPETSRIKFNMSYFRYNSNVNASNLYIIILNNDKYNKSIMTITTTHPPLHPIP